MRLEHTQGVHVLTMESGSQQINADFITAFNAHLDAVEASDGPSALVLAGEGKSYNEGLDLPFLGGLGAKVVPFLKTVHALFGRLYRLDMPTVAAISGHAIAGGAMLAQCADVRIMRADRGWYRLPEVELGMAFTVVMNDLISARIPQPAVHRLMVLGQRIGGTEAAAMGVVDQAVDGEGGSVEVAVAQAASMVAYRGRIIRQIRMDRYRNLMACIDRDPARDDLFIP